MPIPPTRYIDAGPGVPLANPQAAIMQGEAMARMGTTIQHVGAIGFEVAEKVRKIDENRKILSLFANMEKDAADFSNGLMRREDTEAWSKDWQAKSQEWMAKAKEVGLSPDGMAAFQDRFTRWNTERTIDFETKAANKSIELGRATLQNTLAFYSNQRNYEAARQDLKTAHGAGTITTPELQANLMKLNQEEIHNGFLDDINTDARGWAEKHPAENPPVNYDPVKWRQLHDYAANIARDQDAEASNTVVDGIVTGEISSYKQIQEKAPNLRPLQQQKLFDALDKWNNETEKARRADPQNMAATVGKFYAALGDWKPDAEGADPAGVELRMMIEQLPEGHPLRDKMKESMHARASRIGEEVKTREDQALATLKDAAERGDFGPVKLPEGDPVETRKAVADGFLLDVPKLQSLGFSEKQAQEIKKDAAKDPALGQAKFRELWKKERPQASANATPFDIAVSDALRGENAYLNWKVTPQDKLDAHEKAARAYGEAIIEFKNWSKLNPDASEEKINAKLRELGSKSARLAPKTSGPVSAPPTRPALPAGPGGASDSLLPIKAGSSPGGASDSLLPDKKKAVNETSMNIPQGTRTTSYGYSGDPFSDSNSAKAIGSFTTEADAKAGKDAPTRLRAGDIAVSPDVEKELRAAGVKPREMITVKLSDGSTHRGRWMDRTRDDLTGRIDIYSPDGPPKNDGSQVVGWSANS